MKKVFSLMILAAVLILVGNNQAEAGEVYVGNYSDGTRVYLLTDTVQKKSWLRSSGYECTVRAGRDYLNYTFWKDYRVSYWDYENSEGYKGQVYDGSSPVAAAILNYLRNNF